MGQEHGQPGQSIWRDLHLDTAGLVFALVVFAVSAGLLHLHKPAASADDLAGQAVADVSVNPTADFTINARGQLLKSAAATGVRVHRYANRDELRFIWINNPGEPLAAAIAVFHLPSGVASNLAKPELITRAVYSKETSVVDAQSLSFSAEGVDPVGTVTVVITLPRGSIKLPMSAKLYDELAGEPALLWADVGLFILTIGVMMLIWLSRRRMVEWQALRRAGAVQTTPPAALPPAVVGVFIRQKFTSREIIATLIDLAERGYLRFSEQPSGTTIVPRKLDPVGLYPHEREVMQLLQSSDRLLKGLDRDVFEAESGRLVIAIYRLVERLGIFARSPRWTHLRWRTGGALITLGGAVGLLFTLRLFPDPPYIALFWLAVTLIGIIIFRLGSGYTAYSETGRGALGAWLAFGRYLASPQPATLDEVSYGSFVHFLAYAVALGVDEAWLQRFRDLPFQSPDWYTPLQPGVTAEQFYQGLIRPAATIGAAISQSVLPTVD